MFYFNHLVKLNRNCCFALLSLVFFTSCESNSSNTKGASLISTDLGKYGIPVTINIPKTSSITESNYSHEKGLLIIGDGFDMRVDAFMEMADSSHDAKLVKKTLLEEKKTEDDFKRLVVDEPTGFIYETEDKELGSNFHFFFVEIKDNIQVEFREGIPKEDNFSLENITQMYNSVQMKKIK